MTVGSQGRRESHGVWDMSAGFPRPHGHGKSSQKLLSWKSPSWNMKISEKVMESSWMSWKSHGIACSHGYGSFLVYDCVHVVRHNHNHIWNHVRMGVMERSKSVMENSWNSVFKFLWEPCVCDWGVWWVPLSVNLRKQEPCLHHQAQGAKSPKSVNAHPTSLNKA